MYRAVGDSRFKDRADYLVRELATVQDKNGDGYLSALENGREASPHCQRARFAQAASI
jgi:DUF1680 family protein